MNELYPFVQEILKNYSHPALLTLLETLAAQPGQPNTGNFNCSSNEQYVLKRLISACLSRDPSIKFNAYFALSTIPIHFPTLISKLNSIKVFDYISTQSDLKQCGGKPIQIQAYTTGKILAVKAFASLFKDKIDVINSIIKIGTQYNQLEEQTIELAGELCVGKKAILAFNKFTPNTKTGFLLFSIIRAKLKNQPLELNESTINDVLSEVVTHYPKRSICLTLLGPQLSSFIDNPAKYLETKFQLAFGDQNEEFNIKYIYYTLQLFKQHINNTEITKQNVWKIINPALIGYWLSQLKVQNKIIRKLAQSISIKFESNSDLALNVLKQLHHSHINLSNVNIKHPLYSLYQTVEPGTYFEYLITLCLPDTNSIETEEDSSNAPIQELQNFILMTNQHLTADQLSRSICIFITKYHTKKDQTNLQALSALFNSLIPHTRKKKQTLHQKASLILSKINIENAEFGQNQEQVKSSIKDIRNRFKSGKQQQNPLIISFYNFLLTVGYYFLIYPQEVQIYSDLQALFEDFKTNFLEVQSGLKPKKKRKLNPQNEKNKPIHVLIDIFISLLTKSPQFLRTSINTLFEDIIPFIDSEDLSHLLEVIQRPDQQYIQEIDNE